MKNNKFIKFSLTVACAAVLAACGSSGGSGDDEAAKQQAAQQQAAQQQAAQQKAAAEAAAKAKAEAEAAAESSTAGSANASNVGAKFVKKTQSNLNVGEGVETNSKSSVKPANMSVDLHPSLDTIVVAIPLDKDGNRIEGAPQAYLEDFDFRGNVANTTGMHTLDHIYKTVDGNTTVGAARTGGEASTKTATKGTQSGLAYVYEDGRLNYTRKAEGSNVVDTKLARTDARLADSVAEVYGHRTFVAGNSEVKNDADGETGLANAPFTAQDASGEFRAGSTLNYVQYGRVTSKLHAVLPPHLKAGKDVVQNGTLVASYGGYGEQGTEDNYFFRGVNDTSAAQVGALKDAYFGSEAAGGKLHYQGHAVTYNLPDDYKLSGNLPNALGAEYALVSGTHVAADIDLASKNVTGKLYNTWTKTNTALSVQPFKHDLVEFNGTLANDGSIAGTAKATAIKGEPTGVLRASLYGDKAQELGGLVSSDDTTNNWGAAFGAKVQNDLYKAPTVTEVPAWGESTDERTKNAAK